MYSMGMGILKFFLYDILLDALYTPVWWYTGGLASIFRFFIRNARYGANVIGIGIWLKSLFKPMYGERTWQGRIVSFVMRLIVLVWDIVIYLILLSALVAILLAWILLPLLLVWQLSRILL